MDTLSFMLGIGTVIFLLLVAGIVAALFRTNKLLDKIQELSDILEYQEREINKLRELSTSYVDSRVDNMGRYLREEFTSVVDSRIDKLTDKLSKKQTLNS